MMTPTTEQVRELYCDSYYLESGFRAEDDFDRWFQKVKAEAYDLGYQQGYDACVEMS